MQKQAVCGSRVEAQAGLPDPLSPPGLLLQRKAGSKASVRVAGGSHLRCKLQPAEGGPQLLLPELEKHRWDSLTVLLLEALPEDL